MSEETEIIEEESAVEPVEADDTGEAGEDLEAGAAEGEELELLIEDAVDGGEWPVEKLVPLLEAALFAAADPLPVKRIRRLVHGATRNEVAAALKELQSHYEGRGIRLLEVAGGWQFRTAPEHQSVVKKIFKEKPVRLTRAGLETLAIVAYKQPATRAEVEAVRGVDCSGVLESLVERKVVKIAGRRDVPGRPLVYATTQLFLEMFGLKNLHALPTLTELGDEFTAMADQAGFDESEEREAPVLPFEEGDGEHTQEGNGEAGLRAAEGEGPDGEDDQRQAGQPDEEDQDGDIPQIRFRSESDDSEEVEELQELEDLEDEIEFESDEDDFEEDDDETSPDLH